MKNLRRITFLHPNILSKVGVYFSATDGEKRGQYPSSFKSR